MPDGGRKVETGNLHRGPGRAAGARGFAIAVSARLVAWPGNGRRRLRFRRRGSLQRRAGRTAARYLRRPQLPGVAGRGQGAANRLRDALRHVPHRLARRRARPAAWSRPGRPSRPGSSPTNSYWTRQQTDTRIPALRRPRRRLDEGRPPTRTAAFTDRAQTVLGASSAGPCSPRSGKEMRTGPGGCPYRSRRTTSDS